MVSSNQGLQGKLAEQSRRKETNDALTEDHHIFSQQRSTVLDKIDSGFCIGQKAS